MTKEVFVIISRKKCRSVIRAVFILFFNSRVRFTTHEIIIVAARAQRKEIAHETVAIQKQGWYLLAGKTQVSIADLQRDAVERSHVVDIGDDAKVLRQPNQSRPDHHGCHIVTTDETTLAAARRLSTQHPTEHIAILNFASAKNPGGGFLNGSLAQEESIALCSSLYACQTHPPVHAAFHQYAAHHASPIYSSRVIFSPAVPVFRDSETNALLEHPYVVSVLSSAAVNAGVARKRGISEAVITAEMSKRIEHILHVAANAGVDHLVLGAYGCGVFENDPDAVAALFNRHVHHFAAAFSSITFAVPARPLSNNAAFRQCFPS